MTKLRNSPSAPSAARNVAQTQRVLLMRQEGRTIQGIADALGISKSTVHKHLMRALDEIREENRELSRHHLGLELERCDMLQRSLAAKVKKGDVRATEATLKVMERRAKLLGLDSAQKLEHAGPDRGPIRLDAASILDGLARLAGDGPADADAAESPSGGTGDDSA